jgi:outer membrane protein W
MAKRCLLVLTLLCLCVFSAFSLDSGNTKNPLSVDFSVSTGGRIFYNGMFNIWEYGGGYAAFNFNTDNLGSANGFGIGMFLDVTYVEISLDFIFGSVKTSHLYSNSWYDAAMKTTHFGFTLLGKYPFAVGSLTVFPLLGIDYQIFLSGKANSAVHSVDYTMTYGREEMFDDFSIAIGAGLDYKLTGALYLRGEFLLNFKLDNKNEAHIRDITSEYGDEFSLFSFGPRVSIGIGYKF